MEAPPCVPGPLDVVENPAGQRKMRESVHRTMEDIGLAGEL